MVFTQLHQNVDELLILELMFVLDYIWMVQVSVENDLPLQLSQDLSFNRLFVDCFDSEMPILIVLIENDFISRSKGSLPQLSHYLIHSILFPFNHFCYRSEVFLAHLNIFIIRS